MATNASVSAVMPTKNPDEDNLKRTVMSLVGQKRVPSELIIVDATAGGIDAEPEESGGCGLCASGIGDALGLLEHQGADTDVVQLGSTDGNTTPMQRRTGIQRATEPVIFELDEDTILARNDHIEKQLSQLQSQDDVVAVGCRAAPLKKSRGGKTAAAAIKRMPQQYSMFQMFPREIDPTGENLYPYDTTKPGSRKSEDNTRNKWLKQHGKIIRDDALVAQTELPTNRQRKIGHVTLAALGGAAVGGVIEALTR